MTNERERSMIDWLENEGIEGAASLGTFGIEEKINDLFPGGILAFVAEDARLIEQWDARVKVGTYSASLCVDEPGGRIIRQDASLDKEATVRIYAGEADTPRRSIDHMCAAAQINGKAEALTADGHLLTITSIMREAEDKGVPGNRRKARIQRIIARREHREAKGA